MNSDRNIEVTKVDYDVLEALREYASMEGTELGEYWNLLAYTYTHLRAEYGSETFQKAIEAEILEQINYIRTHTQVLEHEETKTITRKWSELVFYG